VKSLMKNMLSLYIGAYVKSLMKNMLSLYIGAYVKSLMKNMLSLYIEWLSRVSIVIKVAGRWN